MDLDYSMDYLEIETKYDYEKERYAYRENRPREWYTITDVTSPPQQWIIGMPDF